MASSQIHPTRICTKCGTEKFATREFFPPQGKWLRGECRLCWRAREREYFWANREAKRETACRSRQKQDKGERRRKLMAWRAANPAKVRAAELRRAAKISGDPVERAKQTERARKWRAANPERERQKQRAWRAANPEKSRQYNRAWYERDPQRARAKWKRRRERHPEKLIADVEKRRARMVAAVGEFTGHDVVALLKTHGRICFYCGEKIKKFHLDHFIPLSRGGTNWPDNLVISCCPCNQSKGAKMPWEWMPERFSPGCNPR